MLQPHLDNIATAIKEYNTYFDKVISNVEMSEETGIVHNGNEVIFPADTNGDWCYVRVPSKLAISYDKASDNANRSFVVSAPIHVVAIMKEADPYQLAMNIVSTIGRICNIGKTFTSIIIHSEDVILQELSKCSEAVQAKALQAFISSPSYVAVSVNLTISYTQSFFQLNCITKPCKQCS